MPESLRMELKKPSLYFSDALVKTGRKMLFTGMLFGLWSAKCRNWTCAHDSADFKPYRKVLAALYTTIVPPLAWNIMDAGITRQRLMMKQSGTYVSFTQGMGAVWAEHGLM